MGDGIWGGGTWGRCGDVKGATSGRWDEGETLRRWGEVGDGGGGEGEGRGGLGTLRGRGDAVRMLGG